VPGLIVTDISGGDMTWCVVDDERWAQIKSVSHDFDDVGHSQWQSIVEYLASDDVSYVPKNAPVRKGKILKIFFTQEPVFEDETLDGITGILTL